MRWDSWNLSVFHYDANKLSCAYSGSACETSSYNVTYDYNGEGNLVSSREGLAIDYDARGHTRRIDTPAGDSVALAYQGPTQDERVSKSVTDPVGVTEDTNYAHDLLGLQREETGLETTTVSCRIPSH